MKQTKKLLCILFALVLWLPALPARALAPGDRPGQPATRQMAVSALWELAGRPSVDAALPFADAPQAAEAARAIRWAADEGISCGVGDGLFQPDAPVSREMLAALCFRYGQAVGLDPSAGQETNLSRCPDAPDWSDWAAEALQWAVGAGVLELRNGGRVEARATVTRAEAAGVLNALAALRPLPAAAAVPEGYVLDRMVVLSRHNIRSPLSGEGSVLGDATPHAWFRWTSGTGELSLRGGALETVMGQYFRKYLVAQGVFAENAVPAEGEVRFYANAMQRTIATARYFSTGMFPIAGAEIETHAPYNTMDPVFHPRLTYLTEAYREAALAQIGEMGGEKGLAGLGEGLRDSYSLIERVLDLHDSRAYAGGTLTGFDAGDTQITLELNQEPSMKGSLKTATSVSDALVLQYYEEADSAKAAFGETLTRSDWAGISAVKDFYGDVLFTAPLVAVNVAAPLVRELRGELEAPGRKFAFLCGHDSNVGSVLAALQVRDYTLPGTVEAKTPIGVKLVFEKWVPADGQGEPLASVRLVYQSTDQLRHVSLLDLENPPMSFPVRFQGLAEADDGLYRFSDLMDRMEETAAACEELPLLYGDMAAEEAAA